jgi:16S rRNA processing protein RimM
MGIGWMTVDELLVVVGQVLRPHGLRGELKVLPLTDRTERFEKIRRYHFQANTGQQGEWINLVQFRWQGKYLIMKFEGIESYESAEKYRDTFLEIPRNTCAPLEDDQYYVADLIGLHVRTSDGLSVGTLKEVLQETAQDIYVVHAGSKDVLIPAVRQFIKQIDLDRGEMVVEPIEGLLELYDN